jgi:hypothetical protein
MHASADHFPSFERLIQQKLRLYWEGCAIEQNATLSADIVLPRLSEVDSHGLIALAKLSTLTILHACANGCVTPHQSPTNY